MRANNRFLMAAGMVLGAAEFASASAWITNGGGNWSDTANWDSGGVPNGTTATADFSTLDIGGAGNTVNFDGARTLNQLTFGDQTATTESNGWVLQGGTANTLTLGGTAPTITVTGTGVNGRLMANLNITITGTNGLTFNGNGNTGANYQGQNAVRLRNANSYSGGTTVNSGTLQGTNVASFGSGDVTVNGGEVILGAAGTFANTFYLNGGIIFTTNTTSLNTLNVTANSIVSEFSNATLTLGAVNLGSSALTTDSPTSNNRIIQISSLAGGSGSGITKKTDSDVGTLIILGNNTTYAGTTKIDCGVLQVGNNGSLGTGAFQFGTTTTNSDVQIRSTDSTDHNIANVLSGFAGTARRTFGAASTGNLTFTNSAAIDLAGSTTRKIEGYNTTTFNQGFTGAGAINFNPTGDTLTGTFIVNGNSTYSGATTLDRGTLLVNATHTGTGSGYTVGSPATLGGKGTIARTVTVNGKIAPGSNGVGTLGVGATTFNSGSSLDIELGTGTSDLLAVTGNLTLNGTVMLNLLGTADGVTSYTIATYTGLLSGTFTNPTVPAGYTFSYGTGSNSAITLSVPEPTSMAFVAGSLMMLSKRRRRA